MATTYVEITEDEMKTFLRRVSREITKHDVLLKPGTKGVYFLPFSENVALTVSTSIGSRGSVVDRGKGAIHLSLHSLKTGKALATKAMAQYIGKTRINRTTGWEKNLESAIKLALRSYVQKKDFFERIAIGEDRVQTPVKQDHLKHIESIKKWQDSKTLSYFHSQLSSGQGLSTKQEEILKTMITQLQDLRALYVKAQESNNQRDMDFLISVGNYLKDKGSLSDKQWDVVDQIRKRVQDQRSIKIADAWINQHGLLSFTSNSGKSCPS